MSLDVIMRLKVQDDTLPSQILPPRSLRLRRDEHQRPTTGLHYPGEGLEETASWPSATPIIRDLVST